jgi:hypothetical protein
MSQRRLQTNRLSSRRASQSIGNLLSLSRMSVPTGGARIFQIQYLAVGGGGGTYDGSNRFLTFSGIGGGAAGGFLTGTVDALTGQRMTVTVGAGSSLTVASNSSITTEIGSVFSNVTAIGGGNGGQVLNPGSYNSRVYFGAGSGGSGGGGYAEAQWNGVVATNGTGTPGQGNNGGGGSAQSAGGICAGGGGGGAGGAGSSGTFPGFVGGNGGPGLSSTITGSSVTYAAGGAGSGSSGTGTSTAPAGAINTSAPANGGGGAGAYNGANSPVAVNGGSGVVILRSKFTAIQTTGGVSQTSVAGDVVYTFTSSGSITY